MYLPIEARNHPEIYRQISAPETVTLLHRQTGEEADFTFRLFCPEDADSIISLIRDEYGETYFKSHFYRRESLIECALSNHYLFFVAEHEKSVVGMLILTFFAPFEQRIEPATEIIFHEYRCYGISRPLLVYGCRIAEILEPSCLFIHAVTFHTSIQLLAQDLGYVPTALRLGTFLTENMHNSYSLADLPKYSEGILIRAVQKRDAGVVFLPDEILDFADEKYRQLGVQADLKRAAGSAVSHAKGSNYFIHEDSAQRMIIVDVMDPYPGLARELHSIISKKDEPFWTMQVAIPADRSVYEAYARFREEGFIFAGIKPLCSRKEKLYLQWAPNLLNESHSYQLSPAFIKLRDQLEKINEY